MAEFAGGVCVTRPEYMVPHSTDFIFERNGPHLGIGSLMITDINHKMMFMVKNCETRIHERRVLVDAANMEQPIVTLQKKVRTAHARWQVFRGESTDKSNLIFSIKTPTLQLFQFKTELNAYLSGKKEENSCDFRLAGSWSDRNCTICLGDPDSTTIIAQMHNNHPTENRKLGKDKFVVTISPNVDYAFIIAIFSILNALKGPDFDAKMAAEIAFDAVNLGLGFL